MTNFKITSPFICRYLAAIKPWRTEQKSFDFEHLSEFTLRPFVAFGLACCKSGHINRRRREAGTARGWRPGWAAAGARRDRLSDELWPVRVVVADEHRSRHVLAGAFFDSFVARRNGSEILSVYISACLRVVCDAAVAVKYNSCYAQPATSTSIKRCNKTYHMEKELTAHTSDDVCRYAYISLALLPCLSVRLPLWLSGLYSTVDMHVSTILVNVQRQPVRYRFQLPAFVVDNDNGTAFESGLTNGNR